VNEQVLFVRGSDSSFSDKVRLISLYTYAFIPRREASRLASLNAEITTFQAQVARLQQAENTAKSNLEEKLNPTLSELRGELRAAEDEFQVCAVCCVCGIML